MNHRPRMARKFKLAAVALFGVCGLQMAMAADAPQRPSYGRQEHVRVVGPTPIEVIGALDPSAEYSVLNAEDIKYFQRNGDMWVRFTVDNGSVLQGNHIVLERPVLKDFKVRQRDGGYEHQPRVAIDLCLGVQAFSTEVRLIERDDYTAPLLLGQPDLAKLGSVDRQRQFTQEPRCIAPQPQNQALPQSPLAPANRSEQSPPPTDSALLASPSSSTSITSRAVKNARASSATRRSGEASIGLMSISLIQRCSTTSWLKRTIICSSSTRSTALRPRTPLSAR